MDNEQLPVYNPLPRDFSVTYDTNEDGNPIKYTAISGDVTYFPTFIAHHIAKHLVNELMQVRQKLNNEENRHEIEKEVLPANELADW